MKNDENFCRDGPVVQVWDVAFQDELEGAYGADLVLMLPI